MSVSDLSAALRARGLATRVVFGPAASAAGVLKSMLPQGRVALAAEEGQFAAAQRVRAALSGFTVYMNVLGAGSCGAELFSLPDDVRAAVGIGARGIAAARCFAALRGGCSLAVPASPSARGIWEKCVPAGCGDYPVRPADFVLFDGAMAAEGAALAGQRAASALPPAGMPFAGARAGVAAALAELAPALAAAEDAEADAVFSGRVGQENTFRPAAEAVRAAAAAFCRAAAEGGALSSACEGVFSASALYFLARRDTPPVAAEEAARLAAEKTKQGYPACAAAVCLYFARRYERLFSAAVPRPYFVPDYCARLARAAAETGRALFSNVRVPSGEESARLAALFLQARGRLARGAGLFAEGMAGLLRAYFVAGGAPPALPAGLAGALYDLSAELSPLLCGPALERELGLLPNPRAAAEILFARA